MDNNLTAQYRLLASPLRDNVSLRLAATVGQLGTWEWDIATDRFTEQGLLSGLLGYAASARIQSTKDVVAYTHPDDVDRMRRAHLEAIKGISDEYEIEHRVRHADGSYRWILSHGQVTHRDAGRAKTMHGFYLDVTRHKATEAALEESQKFLRLILDNIPARVFWKDTDCRYLGCNRAFADDAGLTHPDQVKGLSDADLRWSKEADIYQADDRAILESGRNREAVTWPFEDVSGKRVLLEATKIPLRGADNEIVGLLGTFHDVTAREQKLQELNTLANALAKHSDGRLLESLVQAAVELSGARAAFISKVDPAQTRATVTVCYPASAIHEGFSYALADTPCAMSLRDDMCIFPEGVQAAFPRDQLLGQFGIEAFAGRRLANHHGTAIGVLILIRDRAFQNPEALSSILEIIGASAATELAREQRDRDLAENRQQLEIALASGQQGLWQWDLKGDRLSSLGTSGAHHRQFILPPSSKVFWRQLDAADRSALRQALLEHLRGIRTLFEEEVRLFTASGEQRWFLIRGQIIDRNERGIPIRLMGTHTDVTTLKNVEQALEDARRFLSAVLDTVPQAVYWKDTNSRYLGCNQTFATIAGFNSPSDVIGRQDTDLGWSALAARLRAEDLEILSGRRTHIVTEDRITDARGDERWVEKTKVPFCAPDGRIVAILGSTHDVTARKKSEQKIELLAFYDPLTELPNRRYFTERLEEALALARRQEAAGALLYLDLDNFKKINDSLGHSVGDQLLIAASRRICGLLRTEDVVARLGGDEFVVMLGALSLDAGKCTQQARAVALKLTYELSKPFVINDQDLYISTTIGVAVFPEHDDSVEQILKMADAAMYRGKAEGRNTVFFFDPSILAAAEERLRLETSLRTAIERRELSLHYQPQVDAEGIVIGAEALLRWHHPILGAISPAQFIPIAEESGLIVDIGLWAIEEALQALARWDAAGIASGSHLAVNISQRQFRSFTFVNDVIAAMRRHALAPGRLVLELTESAAMERVDETIEKINVLKHAGVAFSIDDFGVGYSSLAYLARLPLQQLKIDRSFINGMNDGQSSAAIVAALLTLGTHLNLAVVAEGIETLDQLQSLVAHGCSKFQGYWFSRPLPESEFIAYCGAHAGSKALRLCG